MSSHRSLKIEILEKMNTLATAGLGLVAALAWNDAIQSLFNKFLHESSGLWAKFVYAIIITAIIVLITYNLSKVINKLEGNKDEER